MALQKLLIDELMKADFGTEKELLNQHQLLIKRNLLDFIRGLETLTRAENQDRESWAKIQYLFGLVIYYHLADTPDNLDRAIAHLEQALTVFSRDSFPVQWATIQNYLGNFVRDLEGGSPVQIEKAIAHYRNALEVRQENTHPTEWRSTQYNLGVAYSMLAKVVAAERQEDCYLQARDCLENSLRHTTPDKEYAEVKIAIGALTQTKITGDKVSNLYRALSCYREAEEAAKTWGQEKLIASAYEYLGHGYRELSGYENREENLQQAYWVYEKALAFYDRNTQAYNWAATQNDLGLVLIQQQSYPQAIARFELALTVFEPKPFPFECIRTASNLGNLAYDNQLWEKAIKGYSQAIAAVEVEISQTSSQQQKQTTLEKYLDLYRRLVTACIASEKKTNLAKAVETVERSRSGYLVDLRVANQLYKKGDIPQSLREKLNKFEEPQKEIYNLKSKYEKQAKMEGKVFPGLTDIISNLNSENSDDIQRLEISNDDIQQLKTLQAERDRAWLRLRDEDLITARQIKVEPISCDRIRKLIDSPQKAIISFYSTYNDTYIFVLRQSGISYHCCANLGLEKLRNWLNQEWFELYQHNKLDWIARMPATLQQLAYKLDLDRLVREQLEDIRELIIVPHQLLHLMPFSALPLADGQYLGDRFVLQIAPSCEALTLLQQQQTEADFTYGTVLCSQSNLRSSVIEEYIIASLYDILKNRRLKAATKENYYLLLQEVRGILSSHHAQFYPKNPLDSELVLNNSNIQLRELLTFKWRISNIEEVFLNCCETGLGIPAATDDLLTIAAGFLCAGAKSVVSTLWVVEDSSAALLSYFYHRAKIDGLSSSRALQQAQTKLRHLSESDLEVAKEQMEFSDRQWKQARKTANEARYKKKYFLDRKVRELIQEVVTKKRSHPLSHPFHWAAFTYQGLG